MKAKKLGRFANKGPSEADLIRFEIKIMKMMSHPNVVRLTDVSVYFLCLPPGGTFD